jgi:hypothetical protein
MSMFLSMVTLLAQIDEPEKLEALGRGFHDECAHTELLALLAVLAALVAVYLTVRLCRRRPSEDMVRASHLAEGAQVLGLNARELDDLRTVAGRASIIHPAVMLLSPANLARAAQTAQQRRTDPNLQKRLDELAVKLFGKRLDHLGP